MIKTLIIDDEEDARFLLRKALTENHSENIEILAEADSVKSGLALIQNHVFELLFLDIKMADGTGFDLLKQCHDRNFAVVFITAFDKFAIKAFEFSAVGYLVKPFKISDLSATIDRFVQQKEHSSKFASPFKILLENYEDHKIKKIVVPNSDGFSVMMLDEILFIKSERNYSEFHLNHGGREISSRSLITYDTLLADQGFFRIHHSYLINLSHVKAFVRSEGGVIKMVNNALLPVSRQKKAELIERFF